MLRWLQGFNIGFEYIQGFCEELNRYKEDILASEQWGQHINRMNMTLVIEMEWNRGGGGWQKKRRLIGNGIEIDIYESCHDIRVEIVKNLSVEASFDFDKEFRRNVCVFTSRHLCF